MGGAREVVDGILQDTEEKIRRRNIQNLLIKGASPNNTGLLDRGPVHPDVDLDAAFVERQRLYRTRLGFTISEDGSLHDIQGRKEDG